jgi:hypothetical protein
MKITFLLNLMTEINIVIHVLIHCALFQTSGTTYTTQRHCYTCINSLCFISDLRYHIYHTEMSWRRLFLSKYIVFVDLLCTTLFYICDSRNIPQCVTTKVISRLIFGEVASALLACKIKKTCVIFLTDQKFFPVWIHETWLFCVLLFHTVNLFVSKTVNSSTAFMSNSHHNVVNL